MKALKLSILFFFFGFCFLRAQDSTNVAQKGEWIVTNQFGIATLEAEDYFKANANVFEGLLGREFYLSNKFSLVSGIEFLRVRADFIDINNAQQFLSNNYVNLPVSLKFYHNKSNKIDLFGEIGFYASHLYNSKTENIHEDITEKEKNLGFNFGQHIMAGLQFKLDEKFDVSFGFKYKSDFASSYKSSKQQFELTEFYAVQIGLSFAP